MADQLSEKSIYQDGAIQVTNKIVTIGRTTIFLKNINSITVEPSDGAKNSPGCMVLGTLFFLAFLIFNTQYSGLPLLLFIVALIYWLLNRGKSNLYFDTSSGRRRGLMLRQLSNTEAGSRKVTSRPSLSVLNSISRIQQAVNATLVVAAMWPR